MVGVWEVGGVVGVGVVCHGGHGGQAVGTRHEFGGELKDLETGICSMVDGSLYVLVRGEEAYYRASRSESNPHPTSFLFRPILNSDSASSPQLCPTFQRLSTMDSEPESEQEPFGRLAIVRDSDTTVRSTLALAFPRTDSDGDEERVHVALDVDAAPGCGGIAWPAGEVGSLT